MQVAVAGVRGRRHHAEGDQRVLVGLGDLEAFPQRPLESRGRPHDLVGGDDRHHRIGVGGGQHGCGPRDRVQRVPTLRLTQDVLRRQLRQFLGHHVRIVGPGAHPHLVRANQAVQPVVRQSQQALPAENTKQLLGHVLARQRPQSLSGAAGHDEHVTHRPRLVRGRCHPRANPGHATDITSITRRFLGQTIRSRPCS